jgi:hypothetical protein
MTYTNEELERMKRSLGVTDEDLKRIKKSLSLEDLGDDFRIFYVYKYLHSKRPDRYTAQIEDVWLTSSGDSPEELARVCVDDKKESYRYISERRHNQPNIVELTDDEWNSFYNTLDKLYKLQNKDGKNRNNEDITRIYTATRGASYNPRVINVKSELIK